MREGGNVNVGVEQDYPCLPLSSPHICRPLEMEKNVFARSIAIDHVPEVKVSYWAKQMQVRVLLD